MNKHIYLPIIACISTLLIMPTAYPYLSTAITTDKSLIAIQISPDEISQIAHKITVKVFAGDSRGSGILIAHQGELYTVVTNAHVVSRGTPYRIQTPDGKVYPGYLKYQGESLKGNDLAVLQFQATTNYSIATFADSSTLAENQSVYAAGFPFEQDSLNLTTGKIAQQITVRIDASNQENGHGSGVIVAKDGQTYYVLTASHVVQNQDNYQIVTPDGRQYPVPYSEVRILEGVDLAVVPFTSSQTYQVATIAKYNFRDGLTPVFVSGFPQLTPGKTTQSQRLLTFGWVWDKNEADFKARDRFSFLQGQELLYTNLSYPGMSGGAVLDTKGRVVGINTAAEEYVDYQQGNRVYLSVGYSLGVPISDFLSFKTQAKIQQQWLRIEEKLPPPALEVLVYMGEQLLTFPVPSKDADALAWLNYGNQMWRGGNLETALAAFERAIQIIQQLPDFNKQLYAQAYYGKGLTLLDRQEYSQAVIAFEQATKIDAKLYQAWRWRGLALQKLKKYPEALTAYKQALEKQPKDFVLNTELGYTLYRLKRYKEAINAFSEALEIKKHTSAYIALGAVYYKLNEYQKALDNYNQALAINPDLDQAYVGRGAVYDELKEYQKALDNYNQALAITHYYTDAYAPAYVGRGAVYHKLKEYQKALADFNQALVINPNDDDTYNERGIVYDKLKEHQKALADFNNAIAINPDDADLYNNRGKVYYELKEYQKALDDCNQAIAINPDFAQAYVGRGIVYIKLKEDQKALADFNQALTINPDFAQAYALRGEVYFFLKEYQKALDDYNKALAINHDFALSYFGRGLVYYELKEYQKTLDDYNKAAQLFQQQGNMQMYQIVQENIKRLPNNP